MYQYELTDPVLRGTRAAAFTAEIIVIKQEEKQSLNILKIGMNMICSCKGSNSNLHLSLFDPS